MKNLILTITVLIFTSLQGCKTLDATLETKDVCQVHNEKMKVTRTWIKYGRRDIEDIHSNSYDCPNAKSEHYGGCLIRKGRSKIYKYYFCQECNRVAKRKKQESTTMVIKYTAG